jgi:uncharacterized protein (UPF0335 family)
MTQKKCSPKADLRIQIPKSSKLLDMIVSYVSRCEALEAERQQLHLMQKSIRKQLDGNLFLLKSIKSLVDNKQLK